MVHRKDRALLKKLLDLTDELARIRRNQQETVHLPRADERALARQARDKLAAMGRVLKEVEGDGPLHLLLQRYRFSRQHVLVMLELLRQRLRGEDAHVKGRELLAILFDSSFKMLQGVRLLAPGSRLLSSGVVIPDLRSAQEEDEPLELRYRLADRAFRLMLKVLRPGRGRGDLAFDPQPRPYRANIHYLMDLRRLALLYQKRAAKVFHFEEWDELGAGLPESITLLNRQIPRFSGHIQACLERTAAASSFPLVRLAHEHRLQEDHLVILITLVFQELTRGNPYLDAVDLLKLVCRTEEDLIRKRKILAPRSPLVARHLCVLEEIVHDKDLSAEVYVPNQVVDHILGSARTSKGQLKIDADSRLQFHQFLNELDSSEDFFERL